MTTKLILICAFSCGHIHYHSHFSGKYNYFLLNWGSNFDLDGKSVMRQQWYRLAMRDL